MPHNTPTVRAALASITARLRDAGVANPGLDARLILERALRCDTARLIAAGNECLPGRVGDEVEAMVQQRAARIPLARVFGKKEFWGLDFALNSDALVPRPDSETLIEAALALCPERGATPTRILDLGTGSGCLLVALLKEWPDAWGVGVDRSVNALSIARQNAETNGVAGRLALVVSDWGDAVSGAFDLIVSNPPYIMSHDIDGLEAEVAVHEPRAALDGGPDGLEAFRRIVAALPRLLSPSGEVMVEFGAGQEEAVRRIFEQSGDVVRKSHYRDLSGHPRCARFRRIPCAHDVHFSEKKLGMAGRSGYRLAN